jgi:hypothetical protein
VAGLREAKRRQEKKKSKKEQNNTEYHQRMNTAFSRGAGRREGRAALYFLIKRARLSINTPIHIHFQFFRHLAAHVWCVRSDAGAGTLLFV